MQLDMNKFTKKMIKQDRESPRLVSLCLVSWPLEYTRQVSLHIFTLINCEGYMD